MDRVDLDSIIWQLLEITIQQLFNVYELPGLTDVRRQWRVNIDVNKYLPISFICIKHVGLGVYVLPGAR